jgi:hypothetical protein
MRGEEGEVQVDRKIDSYQILIKNLPFKDTAGEVMRRTHMAYPPSAKAAKAERRVEARGNQAATRARFIAVAMRRCCKWVFASPI